MTARAGDALSRVYLMRCRTSISSLRKQHFPALFFGRIGCRDLTLRRATRTGTVGRKPIYSARICMGHVPAEHREFGSRLLLAQALQSPTKTLFSGILKYSYG